MRTEALERVYYPRSHREQVGATDPSGPKAQAFETTLQRFPE